MNDYVKIIGSVLIAVVSVLSIIPWIILGVVMLGEHVFGPYFEWVLGTIGGLAK